MQLNKISNHNLHDGLKSLVASEREILSEILLHIVEVERRKLHLTFGFASLFEYLTKSIGYSNGSAQRRIDAARLSFDAPEVINKLETGELNLAQVSLLQKSIRESQVSLKTKVEVKVKEELITQMCNKSYAESEVIVASALNIEPKVLAVTKHQKDDSIRLEVTFTKLQWEKLVKMRELVASSIPYGSSSWDQVLEYVANQVIQKKDKSQVRVCRKVSSRTQSKKIVDSDLSTSIESPSDLSISTDAPLDSDLIRSTEKTNDSVLSNNTKLQSKPLRKPVPIKIQRKIHQRDQCCQYQDKVSGKQCKSTWRLQVDHIQPVWAGGSNEEENLRILCRAHNLELYRQQANISQT